MTPSSSSASSPAAADLHERALGAIQQWLDTLRGPEWSLLVEEREEAQYIARVLELLPRVVAALEHLLDEYDVSDDTCAACANACIALRAARELDND